MLVPVQRIEEQCDKRVHRRLVAFVPCIQIEPIGRVEDQSQTESTHFQILVNRIRAEKLAFLHGTELALENAKDKLPGPPERPS